MNARTKDRPVRFMRANAPGMTDLSKDPRIALLAVCIVSQQGAGFRDKNGTAVVDLREAWCPNCVASGFNTGWGFWRFTCGAEIITDEDATQSEPCGAKKKVGDAP